MIPLPEPVLVTVRRYPSGVGVGVGVGVGGGVGVGVGEDEVTIFASATSIYAEVPP